MNHSDDGNSGTRAPVSEVPSDGHEDSKDGDVIQDREGVDQQPVQPVEEGHRRGETQRKQGVSESNHNVVSPDPRANQAVVRIRDFPFRCTKTVGGRSAKRACDSFKGEALAPPVLQQALAAEDVILQGKREQRGGETSQ